MRTEAVPHLPPVRRRSAPASAVAIHSLTLMFFMAASSAPTPLYRLYQARWHFSPLVLTTIFAVYALALLATMLVAGGVSDHTGRKPIIGIALLIEVAAMSLFLTADGSMMLIGARIVQGVATGLATAALGAALVDLDQERGALVNSLAPMIGMACGSVGATALSQLAPAPLRTVFVVLIVLFMTQLAATLGTRETASKRPGALRSLWPRVAVPSAARRAYWMATPINIAIWMVGGFYLSLMPSLIAKATGATSVWFGGASVALLTLSGGAAILLARRLPSRTALIGGALILGVGVPTILAGADLGHMGPLLAGSLVSGIGFGAAFLGVLRNVLPTAAPHERAGLMAAYYVESYLAFCLPTLAVGYLAQRLDLLTAANLYGSAILVLLSGGISLKLFGGWHRKAA